jgi:hypothetical protein
MSFMNQTSASSFGGHKRNSVSSMRTPAHRLSPERFEVGSQEMYATTLGTTKMKTNAFLRGVKNQTTQQQRSNSKFTDNLLPQLKI